ncbi:MAG: DUF2254 domain-containing protein [Methanotrichaceae archaeon]|nr:DUF2254 domain-containing protein [Methanotrichaceae archaeon]
MSIFLLYLLLLQPTIDANSARYMLSAIVQSEAAIIAIVVSLSLVAVQLVASSYSSRAIEVFKKAPYLWLLLGFYVASMIITFWILMSIGNVTTLSSETSKWVVVSYWLGVVAFLALIPYIWKILELLNPHSIIDRLSKDITVEKIQLAIQPRSKIDPIQPIIDIIISSLDRYDRGVIDYALNVISSKYSQLTKNQNVFSYFFNHFTVILDLAMRKKNEPAATTILGYMYDLGSFFSSSREYPGSLNTMVPLLRDIGIKALDDDLIWVANTVVGLLNEVCYDASKNNLPSVETRAIESLYKVGSYASNLMKMHVAIRAAESLRDLGISEIPWQPHEGE